MTGRKEFFSPVRDNHVRMYVCGVTVYDHCHVGHARSAIVFDTVYRYLLYSGFDVTYVRNFTDVDDKIIGRARVEGVSWKEVSERYIASFLEDMEVLKVLKPTHEPRATEHIEDMIGLIERLIKKGHAYLEAGNVYFSVESYRPYGELSKRTKEEMLSGARVEVDEKKRNPLDFALWKAAMEGEPSFDSPFGKGRPGWHIECSAMSLSYLGNPFDIHGGGMDLIFPHHENERAQTEAATGQKCANIWMHNGFVNIDKEKMSKSLGNIVLMKEFFKEYHPEVLRLLFLLTHYRSPIDYSLTSVQEAEAALSRLYYTAKRVSELIRVACPEPKVDEEAKELEEAFFRALEDDLNTASALSSVFELSKRLNRMVDEADPSNHPLIHDAYATFRSCLQLLGLLNDDPEVFDQTQKARYLKKVGLSIEEVEALLKERHEARKRRDFERADAIRETLLAKGIVLMDKKEGTEWRIR